MGLNQGKSRLSCKHVENAYQHRVCVGSQCELQGLGEKGFNGKAAIVVVVADHGDHMDVELADDERIEVHGQILIIATTIIILELYQPNGVRIIRL